MATSKQRVLSWFRDLAGHDPVYEQFREFYDGGNWRLEKSPDDAPTIIMENQVLRSMVNSVQQTATGRINLARHKLTQVHTLATLIDKNPHSRKNPERIKEILDITWRIV